MWSRCEPSKRLVFDDRNSWRGFPEQPASVTRVKWATIPVPRAVGLDQPLDKLNILYGKRLYVGRLSREGGLGGWQAPTTASPLAAWDFTSSSVFFDVGANMGIYAALHARLRPEATAIAFEPTPDVADCDESITAANDLDVRWERVAISDAEGEATLFLSGRTDASNSLVSGFDSPKAPSRYPQSAWMASCARPG